MNLKPLMTYRANLKPSLVVGDGPFGARQIAEVIGGEFTGERLNGSVLTGGGDWILIDDKGVGRLDVRATFQTNDDAIIYVQYLGILKFNESVAQAISSGSEMDFFDTYFMIQPRFETGDARYSWLNDLVAVGEGRLCKQAVEYRVLECRNPDHNRKPEGDKS